MVDDWLSLFARVKSALRRRGCSAHDAEDLVQDAFVRLIRYGIDKIVKNPEAVPMTTAINLSHDAHRAQGHHGEEVVLEDEVLVDTAPGTEDVMLSRERLDQLSKCIARLPQKTRSIFLAHRVEGVDYQEIARRHRLSVSSVEKHVAKAVLLVTGWMEGWYP